MAKSEEGVTSNPKMGIEMGWILMWVMLGKRRRQGGKGHWKWLQRKGLAYKVGVYGGLLFISPEDMHGPIRNSVPKTSQLFLRNGITFRILLLF